MSWKTFTGEVKGVRVEGDADSPPTRWWNHLFLALWGWKTVAVFEVDPQDARRGYRVGYIPFTGSPMIKEQINHDGGFRMKIGHETCNFFAVDAEGREITLSLITKTKIDNPIHASLPFH